MFRAALIGLCLAAVPFASAFAQDSTRPVRIVEEVPALKLPSPVSAGETPSGLPVPRYVSLKVGKANCRIGPSLGHRTAFQYSRRGLPLVVVAETEHWRRVTDINGDSCWIRATGLSGQRRAVPTAPLEVLAKPEVGARIRAVAERGAVLELGECRQGWCEVRADGLKGWARQAGLWGASPLL